MPYEQEKFDALRTKISEAFDDVSYPKGFITEHECEECFGVRKAFLNKNWRDVSPKILQENYDKLPLFSPEAFQCFLPAYLLYSLEHFKEDEVYDFTVYTLMVKCSEIKENSEYWKHRFQFFTKKQLYLVYEFMDSAIEESEYKHSVKQLKCGKQLLEEYVEPNLN